MNITADANVLIRALIGDHPAQAKAAKQALDTATRIVIPLPALCEFVWVLARYYKQKSAAIANSLRGLLSNKKVDVDLTAVQAGLAMLDAGGDFADGVIAFDGRRLGGNVFVSFDKQATRLVRVAGGDAELLTSE